MSYGNSPRKLNVLTDVEVPTPADGEALTWVAANLRWEPVAGGGGGQSNTASNQGVGGVGLYDSKVSADLQFRNINAADAKITVSHDVGNKEVDIGFGSVNLDDLADVVETAIATGEILKYDGANWINNTLAEAGIAAASHTHTLADVTDSGALAALATVGTTEIDNDAVTYAKIQDVSQTDVLLGRDTAGAGIVEEIAPAAIRTMINVEDGATADQTAADIRALGFFDTSNDGSASGLDADLLDGMDSDEFINAGLSTGTVNGGVLSVGTPNTTFSISDGTGLIVDTTTDPANPTLTEVSWTGKTNIAVTNLLTNLLTWVAIDSGGNVIQQTTRFTSADHRDYITLGVVVHVDKTIVDTVNNEHGVAGNVAAQISDVMEGLGFVNKSGNVFSANGANLNLNKSVGEIMNHGVNWDVDPQNPHHKTLAALTALTFQYRFQDGTNGATGIAVDPDIYDVGGTSTAVPTNKFTIQRINSFVSNNVKIQPGQTLYNSLADAKAAIQIESFVTEPSIESNGLLRGFLIVQEGCTDLTNTSEAFFLAASKFGDAAGAGGLSVTTLQAAYDNAVSNPEILTNSTNGAVAFRRGSAADTDTVVTVQDNAATVNFSVTGEGVVAVAGTVDGRDIATDGTKLDGIEALADVTDATNVAAAGAAMETGATFSGAVDFSGTDHAGLKLISLTTTQRDLLTPANGMLIYNSTTANIEKYEDAAWSAVGSGGGGSIPESIFGGEAAAHSVNTTTAFAPIEYVDLTTVEVLVRAFDDTTEEYMQGSFTVPADLGAGASNVTFEVHGWAKTVHASNNKVKFTFGHRPVADSEAMDGTYTDEDSGDLTTDATQNDLDILTWTETITNLGWVAGDVVHYRFSRIDASATELAGDYYVWKFIIRVPRA